MFFFVNGILEGEKQKIVKEENEKKQLLAKSVGIL